MIRALGVVGVGVLAAYIAANGWNIAGINLLNLPLALVAFSVFCCGLVYTLRSI